VERLAEAEELGESEREADAEILALGEADADTLEPLTKAVRLAPGDSGLQIAVKLITPCVIKAVATVKTISSSVITTGKLATTSVARAAGVPIHVLCVSILVAVVVVMKPVVLVAVPRASVPLALTREVKHWG